MSQTNKKLVIITAPSGHFGSIVVLLGAAAITDVALDRNTDKVKFVAVIADSDATGDTLTGLPDDKQIAVKFEDVSEDGTIKTRIKTAKYAQIATIERRNGMYAITGDKDIANCPSFFGVVDQVKKKKVAAFDTAFAHTSGQKNTWVGMMNRTARLAHIDAKPIVGARFGLLGLIITTDKSPDVKMINWATLATWFKDNNGSNVPDYKRIYSGDGDVRSLSHVNGDRMVVNTDDGKTTLDLSALNNGQTTKVMSKEISDLASNLVGLYPGTNNTIAFVDELAGGYDNAVIRFVDTENLPLLLLQDYVQQASA
ncbi:MAG: hypothetical protein AAB337_02490 [Patescibacteria group bacterium]